MLHSTRRKCSDLCPLPGSRRSDAPLSILHNSLWLFPTATKVALCSLHSKYFRDDAPGTRAPEHQSTATLGPTEMKQFSGRDILRLFQLAIEQAALCEGSLLMRLYNQSTSHVTHFSGKNQKSTRKGFKFCLTPFTTSSMYRRQETVSFQPRIPRVLGPVSKLHKRLSGELLTEVRPRSLAATSAQSSHNLTRAPRVLLGLSHRNEHSKRRPNVWQRHNGKLGYKGGILKHRGHLAMLAQHRLGPAGLARPQRRPSIVWVLPGWHATQCRPGILWVLPGCCSM